MENEVRDNKQEGRFELALEIVRSEGLKIVPTCQFVSAYLRRHPEYQELVD